MKKVLMAEMTAKEYKKALEETDTVIIPVGSTEIMGTHTPLGADHLLATYLAKRLGESAQCIVAPTVPIGDAMELFHWSRWPGTLSISSDNLKLYYLDICNSFISHGLKRIFFFNNHLINKPAVDYCGRFLRRKGILVAQVDWWRAAFSLSDDLIESDNLPKGHGGEIITSILMAVCPELVDLSQATKDKPKPVWEFHKNHGTFSQGPFYTYPDFAEFCESGGLGDPILASKEKGEKIIERGLKKVTDFLMEFKGLPLPAPLE
jgi:creatinine amidohydrolase